MSTRRTRTVRALTRSLVVAAIVPCSVLALAMAVSAYQRERANRIESTLHTARALVNQTDRELSVNIAVLQALATAISLDEGDDRRFHARASDVLRHSGGDNIVLFDEKLRGRVSVRHVYGTVLPTVRHDRFPQVMPRQETAVSDLFVGEVSGEPQVAAAVPVVREGRAIGRLEMVFKPKRFQDILDRQRFDPGWTAAILDTSGQIVARNRAAAQYIGKPVAPAALAQINGRDEGSFDGRTRDGIDSVACYARSPTYGWVVVVGVPVASLHADLARRLGLVGVASLLLLVLGWWLANRLAQRIAEPVRALVAPALAIGRGEPAVIPVDDLAEANDVALALQQAQALLQQREEARQQADAARIESESRLRMALDASEIGDWDLNLRTNELKHSARHDRCFGYEQAIANWNVSKFLRHVHAEDRERVDRHMAGVIAERTPAWRLDFRVVWPDGSVHMLATRGLLVMEGGEPLRLLGMIIDMTDRLQAETLRLERVHLEAENRQIVEANRIKSEFLANMSHELRTPLNAVIGFADILSATPLPPDSPKGREYLGYIATGGRHLLQIINDVLDLAKVESGKFELFPSPVDLPRLVDEVTGLLQAEAAHKGITLGVELDPSLHGLVLDAARLKQVLYNFLSNAIKFTGPGGRVTLRSRADGDDAFRVEVEDNGVGISLADQARLFTPFQQVNTGANKAHGGTGLGLALTRQLAELQGGSVGVRSEPGVGSVFHVRLPRVLVIVAAPPREANSSEGGPT